LILIRIDWEARKPYRQVLKRKDLAAIGTNPGNVVTGHAPKVFIQARLTDLEAAGTAPAKAAVAPAANTILNQDLFRFLEL